MFPYGTTGQERPFGPFGEGDPVMDDRPATLQPAEELVRKSKASRMKVPNIARRALPS